jgi:hypothetical protein
MDNRGDAGDPVYMKKGSSHPHLKFRFWCGAAGTHVSDYRYSGKVDELFQDEDILAAEQCTGIMDIDGQWVYEGDIVEIPVEADMPAWEGGVQVGAELISQLAGVNLEVEVSRDPCAPCNLYLSGRVKGLEITLPIGWSMRGKVVGHSLSRKRAEVRSGS